MGKPQAMADAGAVRQFVKFAKASGLSLTSILDEELSAIVAASAVAERVPAHGIVDLLQVCSVVAGRPDLGISFAAWGNLRGYGPLSILWDHCPTMGEAIRVTQRFQHMESGALTTTVEEQGDEVVLRTVLLVPTRYGGSQFLEGTLALSILIGRLILGQDWAPEFVEFQHAAPASLRNHHNFFRCPVSFGADRCAIIGKKADMSRLTGVGNAHMLGYLERHLEATEKSWPTSVVQQVEQIISTNLAGGSVSLHQVAGALGTNSRTLQRRLTAHGQTFNQVVEQVRRREVEAYFQSEARPNLSELAYRLGYADTSAVSRFLRTKLGVGLRRELSTAPEMKSANRLFHDA